jgi:hypothetical protein
MSELRIVESFGSLHVGLTFLLAFFLQAFVPGPYNALSLWVKTDRCSSSFSDNFSAVSVAVVRGWRSLHHAPSVLRRDVTADTHRTSNKRLLGKTKELSRNTTATRVKVWSRNGLRDSTGQEEHELHRTRDTAGSVMKQLHNRTGEKTLEASYTLFTDHDLW